MVFLTTEQIQDVCSEVGKISGVDHFIAKTANFVAQTLFFLSFLD